MDPRFTNTPIFDLRRTEWTLDRIKSYIDVLFQKIELVNGWKFLETQWSQSNKNRREELKKHLLKILKAKIQKPQGDVLTYDIQVPELIYDQFFYIGGYLKLPMFQLYDSPIIFRKNILKLRTNTITVNMNLNQGYDLSLFNRRIPFDLLLTCFYSFEELKEIESAYHDSPAIVSIIDKCSDTISMEELDARIHKLGSYFSTTSGDQMKKGRSLLFSLNAAYEVDIFNQKLFKTSGILSEILAALYEGTRSDTDVTQKRIRFTEYILSPLIRKVYDMVLVMNNSSRVKFQIPQTILFESCNKSDIVRFNFPINPVSELATFCQCTLTGPGGFKKDNVPSHLRNLDDTQFGRLCPADTPDRSGCGITLNMVPTVDLKENGMFGVADKEVVTSYPISLTPFLKNDDQTRLQMASNQAKQSILLKEAEKPLIRSGMESSFLDRSTFFHRAEEDGKVMHIDSSVMIVSYNSGKVDMFDIGYRSNTQGIIDVIHPRVKEGVCFQTGCILCESHFIKNGELRLGQNLCTGIMIWEGFNYEDGIVISRSVAEKRFTSIHSVDLTFQINPSQVLLSLKNDEYIPLPKVGQILSKGEPYAKIKILDIGEGFESINLEPTELCSPIKCTVSRVDIYPNYWNKSVKEYDDFIQTLLIKQSERYAIIENKLRGVLSPDETENVLQLHNLTRFDCMARKGKYAIKGQKLKGVMIKIKAIYEEKIGIGDKIANRHGNKGVISLIEDDEKMPTLPDGRRLDIILNPLGIISRMNAGQLFELHMGECIHKLKKNISSLYPDIDKIKEHFKGFLDIVDKTPNRWVTENLLSPFENITDANHSLAHLLDLIYVIQPPFQSVSPSELHTAMQYVDANYKYKLLLPEDNIEIENPIACGYTYFQKLVHRSSDKMAARSIGPYSKKTMQPLGGRTRQGGHRLGEMEVWALMAHGAKYLLKDFLTVQSDSPGLKNKLLAGFLENPELAIDSKSDVRPQSLRLLDAYLKILGLALDE